MKESLLDNCKNEINISQYNSISPKYVIEDFIRSKSEVEELKNALVAGRIYNLECKKDENNRIQMQLYGKNRRV